MKERYIHRKIHRESSQPHWWCSDLWKDGAQSPGRKHTTERDATLVKTIRQNTLLRNYQCLPVVVEASVDQLPNSGPRFFSFVSGFPDWPFRAFKGSASRRACPRATGLQRDIIIADSIDLSMMQLHALK